MKRIISLLLAVSMVLSMFVTVFAATTYPDLVGDNAVFAAAVDALTELKVVNGFPDGQFKPGDELTRAELAKMLVICLGLGEQVDALATRTVFSDVPATHWAAGYINAAAQSKVIIGYPDGTFKPEQSVSYAEAFTMALRALGYGNVVEAEGTWPTAYMLKAVELELTDDMVGEIKPAAAALRGNTAILLWNMLRTPMWRITEESETNGMTLSDRNQRIMLNVKFPNYMYAEDVYLSNVTVSDYEDVTATIDGDLDFRDGNGYTATLKDEDLTQLVIGMKVTVLVKDYKDEDKATFLTLTPANTIVAGFAEELKVKDNKTTFKVDGKEYRLDGQGELDPEAYYVLEVDGKKVLNGKRLPTDGTYAKTQSVLDSDIDEDALVIVDGEWGSVEDVALGSVYTLVEDQTCDYWMVNSKSTKATFDVLFDEKEDWNDGKIEITYLSLDDKDTRIADGFEAFEKENNNTKIAEAKLRVAIKDNDYTDNEVEVFRTFLGLPLRLHFGDVDKNAKNAGFYAVTSNGAASEGSLKGKIYNLTLVNQEAKEDDYKTVVGIEMEEDGRIASNTDIYATFEDAGPVFVWAKLDDNGDIEELVQLVDGLVKTEESTYTGKYVIAAMADGAKITDKKLALANGEEYSVQKSAYFFEVSATYNDKDKVNGLEVKVSRDRTEYEDTELPQGTLVAYDPENDNKIKYVFLAGESESKLQWGKVEAVNAAKGTVSLNTTSATELKEDETEGAAKGDLVGYTMDKDEKKVTIKRIQSMDDLDDAYVVDGNYDYDDDDEPDYIACLDDNFTLDSDDQEYKDHKKFKVVKVTLKGKVDEMLEVANVEIAEGKGHAGVYDVVAEDGFNWERIVVREADKTIFVFCGPFDEDTTTQAGKLIRGEAEEKPAPSSEPVEEPSAPVEEPSAPAEEPSAPTQEPSAPTQEPSAPTQEPSAPAEEPSAPTQEPSAPTQEPSAPAEEQSEPRV